MNLIDTFLGEPKISEFEISIAIYQDIFWLQITIENMILMQILEGQQHVCRVELGGRLLESANSLKVKEELAARAVFEHIV